MSEDNLTLPILKKYILKQLFHQNYQIFRAIILLNLQVQILE
jgi:hypothetical protein